MPDGTSLWVENVEVPLDGSTPQRLPQEYPRSDPDAISPDGTRVAYDDHGSLVVAAADGSDAREVSGHSVLDPVWSPTGDRIAFIYSEKDVYKSNELRVLDVATGEVTPLAGMGGSVEIWNIQFSPEGDRILFAGPRIEKRARVRCGASASTAPMPASSSPGRSRGTGCRADRAACSAWCSSQCRTDPQGPDGTWPG